MRHRLSFATLAFFTAVCAWTAGVQAQAPRMPAPTLQRIQKVRPALDTAAAIKEGETPSTPTKAPLQDPDARRGVRVGWTVLGAVLGYVYYQSAVSDTGDGDFAAPFSVLLFVGVGAALGTLVGMILE